MKIDSEKLKERINDNYDIIGDQYTIAMIKLETLLKIIAELEKKEKNNYQERVISVTSEDYNA